MRLSLQFSRIAGSRRMHLRGIVACFRLSRRRPRRSPAFWSIRATTRQTARATCTTTLPRAWRRSARWVRRLDSRSMRSDDSGRLYRRQPAPVRRAGVFEQQQPGLQRRCAARRLQALHRSRRRICRHPLGLGIRARLALFLVGAGRQIRGPSAPAAVHRSRHRS